MLRAALDDNATCVEATLTSQHREQREQCEGDRRRASDERGYWRDIGIGRGEGGEEEGGADERLTLDDGRGVIDSYERMIVPEKVAS